MNLPTKLSDALAGINWSIGDDAGCHRWVLFADTYVLKIEHGDSDYGANENEVAWYEYQPDYVAETKLVEVDVHLSKLFADCNFVVQERVAVGDGPIDYLWDVANAMEDAGDDEWLCTDDLHHGNFGRKQDGRIVMIDMGHCHPENGSALSFGHETFISEERVEELRAVVA